MKRFVVVCTMRRGKVNHEPLDMDGQLAAFNQALTDANTDAQTPRSLLPRTFPEKQWSPQK